MKNKGMTLVELIVSIALISMVMVFLTKLLVSVSANSLSVITKGEYQEAATILTKDIQDELLKEEVKYLYKCDSTDTCVKIAFQSGNNLRIQIGADKKTIEVTKTSNDGTVLSYEKKQTPQKEGETYIGKFDDLSYHASTLTPSDPNYDYEYKSLMNLEFNIYDKQDNPYLVQVSYPYDSGDLDLTNYLSGLEDRINELESSLTNANSKITALENNYETQNTYSTTEHWTGKYWIDGKKLYTKTFVYTWTGNYDTGIASSSIGVIYIVGNSFCDGGVQVIPANWPYGPTPSNSNGLSFNKSTGGNVFLEFRGVTRTYTCYVTVEYTKTIEP